MLKSQHALNKNKIKCLSPCATHLESSGRLSGFLLLSSLHLKIYELL